MTRHGVSILAILDTRPIGQPEADAWFASEAPLNIPAAKAVRLNEDWSHTILAKQNRDWATYPNSKNRHFPRPFRC